MDEIEHGARRSQSSAYENRIPKIANGAHVGFLSLKPTAALIPGRIFCNIVSLVEPLLQLCREIILVGQCTRAR
jgi:hypothetical protein